MKTLKVFIGTRVIKDDFFNKVIGTQLCYGLLINDTRVHYIGKHIHGEEEATLLKTANKLAKKIKEEGFEFYTIINGERIRFTNKQVVTCDCLNNQKLELFKKQLKISLKKLVP